MEKFYSSQVVFMLLSKRELSVGINVNIHMSSGGSANYVPVGLQRYENVLGATPGRLRRMLEDTKMPEWMLVNQRRQFVEYGDIQGAAKCEASL